MRARAASPGPAIRRRLTSAGAAWLVAAWGAACAPAHEPVATPSAPRGPHFEITTTDRFDAGLVPAYAGSHPGPYGWIDAHLTSHLENIRRWVRQRSISAQDDGITPMATMLRDDLRRIGFGEAELVPTAGHPGVWGYYDAHAAQTLVVYMMYDVQPVEAAGWSVKPFDGALVDRPPFGRVLMARGAMNQKGPERAFLNAVEAIVRSQGTLPVNLIVVAEGEEELGSPHFPEIVDKYADRLKQAVGVFFPFSSQDAAGEVSMFLGVKGIVYFELEAKGGPQGGPVNAEIHGSYKVITDSPAWRLTQALASLTSPDGNTILVPGYYDAIRPPSDEEQRLVNGMLGAWTTGEDGQRKALGVDRWIGGMSGSASLMEYLFNTTLNIDGIWSGYSGLGMKTILPNVATARVDSRLVPDQDPDSALALIRRYLDAKGFQDVALRKLSGYPAAQTSVDAPIVRAALSVYNKYGLPTSVAPRLAGSAPYYVFTDRLGLPLVAGGIGYASGAHGPDEFLVITPEQGSAVAGLREIEKAYVDLLYAIAGGN